MASKKEKLRTQRNRTKDALGIVSKANNNPNRFDEQIAAQRTADRMAATEQRLQADGKLYRLRIPCGEIVGTLDILNEYAKQLGITNTPTKL